ncbi:hypothetical protein ACFWPV_09740 [Streptomyces uncialis]|uniref:hypothetical protein n=1 Tax=Streptomyces uncialis TaxID=1048205 RepID=UPI0036645D90
MDCPELASAYQRLEAAIKEVAHLEEMSGVLAEWIVVASTIGYDSDGTPTAYTGALFPDDGTPRPYHRLIGLLDYSLTRLRAHITSAE